MRVTVTLDARGKNMNDAIDALIEEWRKVVDDPTATLPTDAEMRLSQDTLISNYYSITYVARVKADRGETAK
jgi:hypothetical protein